MSVFEELSPKIVHEQKAEVQQEYKLIGSLKIKKGLKLYKLNLETLEYKEVTITKQVAVDLKGEPVTSNKVTFEKGHIYFQALNLSNAKKHAMKELEKMFRKSIEVKLSKDEQAIES